MDLKDDVGFGKERVGRRLDGRPRVLVVVVANVRALTGTRFDAHFDFFCHQSLDGLGDNRHPRLARSVLFGYCEFHGPFSRRRVAPRQARSTSSLRRAGFRTRLPTCLTSPLRAPERTEARPRRPLAG